MSLRKQENLTKYPLGGVISSRITKEGRPKKFRKTWKFEELIPEKLVTWRMKTTLDNIENSEYLSELDELLAKAVQRGEALKMPKPKLHYKQKRQRARMRYERYKHRDWYVNYRKRFESSLKRKYSTLRRKMLKRGIGFNLAYEDYVMAWICCKPVNGGPAWLQTGRQKGRVKLERIDSSKPYSKDNIQITHGKEVLWP